MQITITAKVPGSFEQSPVPAGALARIAADIEDGYTTGAFLVGEVNVSWTAE